MILEGLITDENQQPLPGANIFSPHSSAVADSEGFFSIETLPGHVLDVSFIGMISEQYVVEEGVSFATIDLAEDDNLLDEATVTASSGKSYSGIFKLLIVAALVYLIASDT